MSVLDTTFPNLDPLPRPGGTRREVRARIARTSVLKRLEAAPIEFGVAKNWAPRYAAALTALVADGRVELVEQRYRLITTET